jgi:predicted ATPase/tetratricopeptide (TPR) repeat protein
MLIIDNFEHLLDGAVLLSRIIKTSPGVQILTTSRERLNLHQEQVYPLQGLEFPEVTLASSAADYSAGRLFLQAARRQRPDFTIKETELEYLAIICRLVEGMPLALELAATWTDMLPLSDIAAEIQHNFNFLATKFQDMPPRHRSIRAVIDASWEKLHPEQQLLFSQLSVFRGGFTREAATAITGATIQNLAILVNKSMLRYVRSQDRYYIHELLRQFGEDKLTRQKCQAENIFDNHSQYYCEWFENQVTPEIFINKGQKAVLDSMTAELQNTQAAWNWALKNQQIKRLIAKTTAFGMYYVWRGGFQEGERIFRSFISLLTDLEPRKGTNSEILRASLLSWQSYFLSELGNRAKAYELVLESQKALKSPCLAEKDTRAVRAHNLANMSRAGWWQPPEIRMKQIAEARSLYCEVGYPFELPYSLTASTSLALVTGQLKEAEETLSESLEILETQGNQLDWADTMIGLGNLSFVKNDYAKAETHFLQAVEIAKEVEDLQRITTASIYLGTTYLYWGQFNKAQRVLERCVANSTDLGLQTRCAASLLYLGYAYLHLGDYDAAAHSGNLSLPLAQETNYKEIIAQAIMLPAAIALTNGAFTTALHGFEQAEKALDSRRFTRVLFGEDCGQLGLGIALLQLDRMDEAQAVLNSLSQQATITNRQDKLLYALVGNAFLSTKRGDAEKAVAMYTLAASQPFVGNSFWFSGVFGNQIEAASASLPTEKVEQMRLHRDNDDFWEMADQLLFENVIA